MGEWVPGFDGRMEWREVSEMKLNILLAAVLFGLLVYTAVGA